jgi:hypothetical protein
MQRVLLFICVLVYWLGLSLLADFTHMHNETWGLSSSSYLPVQQQEVNCVEVVITINAE